MRVRADDWSKLAKPQPCAECGVETWAWLDCREMPLHFQCSKAPTTVDTSKMKPLTRIAFEYVFAEALANHR